MIESERNAYRNKVLEEAAMAMENTHRSGGAKVLRSMKEGPLSPEDWKADIESRLRELESVATSNRQCAQPSKAAEDPRVSFEKQFPPPGSVAWHIGGWYKPVFRDEWARLEHAMYQGRYEGYCAAISKNGDD